MICDLYTFDSILVFDIILYGIWNHVLRETFYVSKNYSNLNLNTVLKPMGLEARTSINEHF